MSPFKMHCFSFSNYIMRTSAQYNFQAANNELFSFLNKSILYNLCFYISARTKGLKGLNFVPMNNKDCEKVKK